MYLKGSWIKCLERSVPYDAGSGSRISTCISEPASAFWKWFHGRAMRVIWGDLRVFDTRIGRGVNL